LVEKLDFLPTIDVELPGGVHPVGIRGIVTFRIEDEVFKPASPFFDRSVTVKRLVLAVFPSPSSELRVEIGVLGRVPDGDRVTPGEVEPTEGGITLLRSLPAFKVAEIFDCLSISVSDNSSKVFTMSTQQLSKANGAIWRFFRDNIILTRN
jgi:hypothetical protein